MKITQEQINTILSILEQENIRVQAYGAIQKMFNTLDKDA